MPKKWVLVILLILVTTSIPITTVQAARGAPGSSEFGFGSHLAVNGPLLDPALDMAGNLPLDWIGIDYAWSLYSPTAATSPDWSALDRVMNYAADHQIAVMLSINAAPTWAMTPQGPDAQQTAQLVARLVERYPVALQAIELFPGANTRAGWGEQPSPADYAALAATVRWQLQQAGSPALLVLAGLTPVSPGGSEGNIDDLLFLQGLYDAGIHTSGDIISLQLDNLTGAPLVAAEGQERRILRHYEEVRQVMVGNLQENDLIWVSRLQAPCGTINVEDQRYRNSQEQTAWLVQAYTQLRAQLYIGAVFYDALNPGGVSSCSHQGSPLLLDPTSNHSFYPKLRELIATNAPETMLSRRGRPKDGEFIKSRP